MSTENQARSLMMRHHHMVKNRQQSMLNRTATEVGMEDTHYWGHIQGKPQPIPTTGVTFKANRSLAFKQVTIAATPR